MQLEGGRGGLHKTSSGGNKKDCWKSAEHFNNNKKKICAKRETCVNYVIHSVEMQENDILTLECLITLSQDI